ncbi:hypothetical protein VOLCADRAFT_120077 [Volvox carteri f. nagariensis]|uniref:Uncharacterized protein n=1 Tax=Volvox carteri f. nagariensis TaxID=3068 RepID=D8UJU5_VOLCA|nr:uncharacterized protein VOLCADRAFT_120077 [Volvox carteri f. nagariensis]EFJ40001.1 hypothetical protein VOLCADRAFT_120077 [Volvox carteri f. nagariensis]|eukprot:XP_002958921.1 hypothetical protein VOLCADRAFT_120077 [Volvox carteri f. nagariensis]
MSCHVSCEWPPPGQRNRYDQLPLHPPSASRLRSSYGRGGRGPRLAAPSEELQGRGSVLAAAAAAAAALSAGGGFSGKGRGPGGGKDGGGVEVLSETRFEDVRLHARVERQGGEYKVVLQLPSPASPLSPPWVLHWALDEWSPPPLDCWPPGTARAEGEGGRDDGPCQTHFPPDGRLEISFAPGTCPSRVVFVLKQPAAEGSADGSGEVWYNNGGSNYVVQLRAPPVETFIEKARRVLAAEGSYTHWSLAQRMMLTGEVLDAADAAGPEGMAFIFTWLRLSSTRVLDWYRNANFQPRDVAAVQQHVGERMAEKARSSSHPLNRLLARGALAGLPRGGGNGDDIRMGILHIMRGYGIREGHRPGHDEPFLEQWHQKLHTNTSPDDVIICEAYLAFLHSGNHDDYWRVLWERGRLSREQLGSWPKPLTAWPQHLPHLIPAFQGYLWTLKNWFRTSLERTDLGALARDDLIELVGLVLRSAQITYEDEDMAQCGTLWERVRQRGPGAVQGSGGPLPGERWGREWAVAALAAAERVELSVAAHMDKLYGLVQPHAAAFGSTCRLDPVHVTNFGEEVVRGQTLFVVSLLLQRLEPQLREAAGGAPWQIVSQAGGGSTAAAVAGRVVAVASLSEVQGSSYSQPTVLLASALTGVEDIPPGVVAVLTRSTTDVLSHLAIRARSQRVLLATCFDDNAWKSWQGLAAAEASAAAVVDPAVPELTSAWAVSESYFRLGLVGAKALNLSTLRRRLTEAASGGSKYDIGVPASVALPYGTFERVLAEEPRNAAAAAEVERLTAAAAVAAAAGGFPRDELEELRRVVEEDLVAPPELVRQLAAAAAEQGLIPSADLWWSPSSSSSSVTATNADDGAEGAIWAAVWSAVCRVWASKWTDRAWLSRRALGIGEGELFMSVLLQQVVPFRYAFVLHTSNPVTHTPGELLGEVVVGMGETLVGNYPGRALAFTSAADSGQAKSDGGKIEGGAAPSLPHPLIIARSDANAEDLEQYAAAGLYDSVTLQPLVPRPPDYAADPLFGDPGFRGDLLGRLAGLGRRVADVFGGRDQDVEGHPNDTI